MLVRNSLSIDGVFWEEDYTREKLIFLVSDDRGVLANFRNVKKIEFRYDKPAKRVPGFQDAQVSLGET